MSQKNQAPTAAFDEGVSGKIDVSGDEEIRVFVSREVVATVDGYREVAKVSVRSGALSVSFRLDDNEGEQLAELLRKVVVE
jgi:hypothetical protein